MHRGLLLAALCACTLSDAFAQQSGSPLVAPAPMPQAQRDTLANLPDDVRIYEEFRYWRTFQPTDVQKAAVEHYETFLERQGVAAAERARHIEVIEQQGRRLEVDRWNRILTAERPGFNTNPNAFLVDVAEGRRPGRALDVGMGQGRNACTWPNRGGMSRDSIRRSRRLPPPKRKRNAAT